MKPIALLFALTLTALATEQPQLRIVLGDEGHPVNNVQGYPQLLGLTGAPPHTGFQAMSIINHGLTGRELVFNVEILNVGAAHFNAKQINRARVVFPPGQTRGAKVLRDFYRFSLLNSDGVVVATRIASTTPYALWDAFDIDGDRARFGASCPGLSSGRAMQEDTANGAGRLDISSVADGEYTLVVESDWEGHFGQYDVVFIPMRIEQTQITLLP